jgi:hypothetical protein
MPKHHIIITVQSSPESKIKFGPFEEADTQKITSGLDRAKGKKITKVETEPET